MIYTFYSYKGGVGRTHLLANIAAYLCHYRKRKVLLIDWDLEAPGLHYYFDKENKDITSDGLIELCQHYIAQFEQSSEVRPLEEKDLCFPTEENGFITNMLRNENGGKIDLLPATHYNKGYHARINEFDWLDFYDNKEGYIYLAWLKEQLQKRTDYDYVLIDSRTGQNDYSGICNVMMPDVNVLVTAPNTQNLVGAREMADRILESDYLKEGNRKPFILPVLSRLVRDAESKEKWRDDFSNTFADLLPLVTQTPLDNPRHTIEYEYLPATEIAHGQFMGEKLFFTKKAEPIKEGDTEHNIQNIAHYLIEIKETGGIAFGKKIQNQTKDNQPKTEAEAYFNMGVSFLFLKRYEEAKAQYLEAIKIEPNHHEAWFGLGFVYHELKDRLNTIEAYQKAISIKPDYHEAWYNLGIVFDELKDYPQAIKAYQKAITIKHDKHKAWYNLGLTYSKQQNYSKAQECFEKTVTINSKDDDAFFNLACLYSLQQNKAQALAYLQQAIALNPKKWKEKAKTDLDFEWLWSDADFQALVGE